MSPLAPRPASFEKSRRLRENILMRIYDENDMEAPEMASAKAGLDALVEELKTAGESKVSASLAKTCPLNS